MEKGAKRRVEVRRVIRAPRTRVFQAWTRPEELARWSCPEGATVEEVEADARPGGGYRLVMRTPDGDRHTAFGTYRVVEPPSKLVYTWDWAEEAGSVGETLVTVELREVEEGTEVLLTHEGFPAAEAAQGHRDGWESCLNRLEALAVEWSA